MEKFSFVIRGPTKNSVHRFIRVEAINYRMAIEKMLARFQNRFVRINKPTLMDLKNALKEVAKQSKANKGKIFYVNNVDGECEVSEEIGKEPLAAYRNGGEIALDEYGEPPAKKEPKEKPAKKEPKEKKVKKLKTTPLSDEEFKVFNCLYKARQSMTALEISKEVSIEMPQVVGAIKTLEEKELVTSKTANHKTLVSLTLKGDSTKIDNEVKQKTKTMKTTAKKSKKVAAKKVAAKKSTAKKAAKKSASPRAAAPRAPKEGGKKVKISTLDMLKNIKKGYTYRTPDGTLKTAFYLEKRGNKESLRDMLEFKP